ncbi:hypothetical protein N656DRAFT_105163 [Canariomyces notabilis]|uniref:Uncharacterized protein n=1 Tax=Canariomyces notabilis TaxID=2074819 RepID=A0AAN6YR73_9PEZI|nr:hypothetical protein N656DRAFT_105163 [Canariomyces arenarius]
MGLKPKDEERDLQKQSPLEETPPPYEGDEYVHRNHRQSSHQESQDLPRSGGEPSNRARHPADSPSAEAERPTLWRRIYRGLAKFTPVQNLSHQQAKQRRHHSWQRTDGRAEPRPGPGIDPAEDDVRWGPRGRAETSRSQPDRLPPRGFRYLIETMLCPPKYRRPGKSVNARWIASMMICTDSLSEHLSRDLPWLGNLHRCWDDHIEVAPHPVERTVKTYKRAISVAYMNAELSAGEWQVTITVWSRNGQWLQDLTYEDMGKLIDFDSAVRVVGYRRLSDDPLAACEAFYVNFLKLAADFELQMPVMPLHGTPSWELARIVEEHIKRYIPKWPS